MDETIQAKLTYIVFQNAQNNYIVGTFSETKTYHVFTATGIVIDAMEDMTYDLEGIYVDHPKYGKQFQIHHATKILPSQRNAIIHFLCSDSFPTIGKKTAEAIVDELGEHCLEDIKNDETILDRVEKLNKKKRDIILKGIREFDQFNDTYIQLMKYGLDQNKISLLENSYGNVLKVLEENCFRPYYEIYGFGYKSALKIADGMGLSIQDQKRFDALIYETLRNACMRTGNTYIWIANILQVFKEANPQDVLDSIQRLNHLESVTVIDDKIFPFGLYEDEQTIAQQLKLHYFPVEKVEEDDINELMNSMEFANNIQYDDIQKQALRSFFENSCMIINGGPGTGKTTIVKGILDMCQTIYPEATIQLCAPTGRASKRLAQLSNYDSKTIHSLLKWNIDDNTFGANEEDPLDIDFIIIDEFSMVDTHLFASLLKALPTRCRILLIGDEHQLESVSPGTVFKDIIQSQICPIIHLEKIYRQSDGSGIVQLAQQIRLEQSCHYQDGVTFIEKDTHEIVDTVLRLAEEYPDIQVLAPMYHRTGGIDEINLALQNLMNPHKRKKQELKVGTTTFREKDRVMLLKNMPDDDVYNGDMGVIEFIEKDKHNYVVGVDFGNRIVEFDSDLLYYLKHAYCISIHKAQGSEYDNVIVVVDPSSTGMLNKRLLYTAISRAKKNLFIIGNRPLFENRVRLLQTHIRQTNLPNQLKAVIES